MIKIYSAVLVDNLEVQIIGNGLELMAWHTRIQISRSRALTFYSLGQPTLEVYQTVSLLHVES